MKKLIRITTVPLSLEKLLEGQLGYMQNHYEVVAISSDEDRLKRFGEANNVGTYFVPMTRAITPGLDLKALYRLYRFLKKERPLIVHTHTPKAGILGMLAAKMARVPLRLHTVAGMPLMETTGNKRRILKAVEKLTYDSATRIYPNSQGLKEFILQEEFTSSEKVKVLGKGSSNGIDTEYFDPGLVSGTERDRIRESLGISSDHLVFVFVGRLVGDKGINELVRAFLQVHQEHKQTTLLLVGPFEQELDPIDAELFQRIKEHPQIFTTGYQEDVRPYFAVSDVLAFPSYREGFPNVVMQAGAMELPSIVSDINGCNEIIEEGVNGTIIPVKHTRALKEAMERMVKEPQWRQKLRHNSRKRITSSYKRQIYWDLLLEEYRKLEADLV